MSDKLDGIKSEYVEKLKKLALLDAGVDYTNVDTYVKYLQADEPEEIEQEAQAIVADIKQQNTAQDVHHDKTVWNPFKD